MTEPTPVTDLAYPDALTELETILDRLEHDEPDVDRIAVDVARAAELVQHCRGRISSARLKVEEVVGTLAPDEATSNDAAGTATDDADDLPTDGA